MQYGTEPFLYSKKLVCFVDFLGMRNRIKTIPRGEVNRFIIRMEKILKGVVDLNPSADIDITREPSSIMCNAFSDCVCYSIQLNQGSVEERKNQIFNFLNRISLMQANLSQLGLVVRGAMVVGEHYSSKQMIYSKALVEAYSLESQTVENPVIFIDESVRNEIRSLTPPTVQAAREAFEQELEEINAFIYKLNDKFYFLDYLSQWDSFLSDDPNTTDFFEIHKDLIENEFKSNAESPSVLAKFEWLACYHNKVVGKLVGDQGRLNSYLINTSEYRISKFQKIAVATSRVQLGIKIAMSGLKKLKSERF